MSVLDCLVFPKVLYITYYQLKECVPCHAILQPSNPNEMQTRNSIVPRYYDLEPDNQKS